MCPKDEKCVRSTSSLTRHINACKNLITLLNCQLPNSTLILKYITTSHLNFLLDNSKENISLEVLNNSKKKSDQ